MQICGLLAFLYAQTLKCNKPVIMSWSDSPDSSSHVHLNISTFGPLHWHLPPPTILLHQCSQSENILTFSCPCLKVSWHLVLVNIHQETAGVRRRLSNRLFPAPMRLWAWASKCQVNINYIAQNYNASVCLYSVHWQFDQKGRKTQKCKQEVMLTTAQTVLRWVISSSDDNETWFPSR